MSEYSIISDVTCDLSEELARELDVTLVPLQFFVDGKTYSHYPDGRELSARAFYALLRAGKTAQTSAITPTGWMDALEPVLAAGRDALIVAFSSALSGTFSGARLAAEELMEKYPERRVEVVDSLCASLGEGLLVWHAAKKRGEGLGLTELRDWLEASKPRLCHWFTVCDLNHLHRGGRVSAATAIIGSVIGIKPVLHVDDEGRLISVEKVRGRKKSLKALLDHMEERAIEPEKQTVFLSHGDCAQEAELLAAEIKRRFGVRDVVINTISPVIGAHSGPDTMALFFLGTKR